MASVRPSRGRSASLTERGPVANAPGAWPWTTAHWAPRPKANTAARARASAAVRAAYQAGL